MNREIDNLLAAAKAVWLGCGVTEVGNLHRAITEFEVARDKSEAPDPYEYENAGLRREI